ncbi:hypothetical protein KI387_042069 [Taxus chinensis]|uniref:Uncharacterized protein n=1 Tax=Taxus chinensis TaxID=29808 RepID=A0AA38C9N8_TAXCH|nr:hypothetical protein KI387_042069 [Taxus chinensis]
MPVTQRRSNFIFFLRFHAYHSYRMSNFWWNFWRKQLAMGVCAVAGLLSKARQIPIRIQTLILSIHQYPPGFCSDSC